jgi:hypothetical protein
MSRKRKSRKSFAIPVTLVLGILIAAIFWYMYGFKMLLRYILGAGLFATLTGFLVLSINSKFGKKYLYIGKGRR